LALLIQVAILIILTFKTTYILILPIRPMASTMMVTAILITTVAGIFLAPTLRSLGLRDFRATITLQSFRETNLGTVQWSVVAQALPRMMG
jgi:hypothetical protein